MSRSWSYGSLPLGPRCSTASGDGPRRWIAGWLRPTMALPGVRSPPGKTLVCALVTASRPAGRRSGCCSPFNPGSVICRRQGDATLAVFGLPSYPPRDGSGSLTARRERQSGPDQRVPAKGGEPTSKVTPGATRRSRPRRGHCVRRAPRRVRRRQGHETTGVPATSSTTPRS